MENQDQGSPKAGGLRRMVAPTLRIVDSTPTAPPPPSATGGMQKPDPRVASSTGMQPSEPGAVARQSPRADRVQAVFDLPPQAAMLAHSLGPLLVWEERSRYSELGFEGIRVENLRVVDGADRMYVDQCLGKANALCQPCDATLAAKKLAELRVLTVHRARDGIDVELMAGAFTQRLAQFPADVVVAACDAWSNREEFWPSWAELKAECDKRMRGRLQIRDALQRAALR